MRYQESHLRDRSRRAASINGTLYGRLYRQFTRARPNESNGTDRAIRFAVHRAFQPRKQSRRERSTKARGYFETARSANKPREALFPAVTTDVPVLSSAIILQNSVFQAAGGPRQSARGLQWCPATAGRALLSSNSQYDILYFS